MIYPVDSAIQLLNNWGLGNNNVNSFRLSRHCCHMPYYHELKHKLLKGHLHCKSDFKLIVVVTIGGLVVKFAVQRKQDFIRAIP